MEEKIRVERVQPYPSKLDKSRKIERHKEDSQEKENKKRKKRGEVGEGHVDTRA